MALGRKKTKQGGGPATGPRGILVGPRPGPGQTKIRGQKRQGPSKRRGNA